MSAIEPRNVRIPHSFRSLTMASGIRAAAERAPGKIAVLHGPRSATYAAFVDRMDLAAGAVIGDLGLAPGENVAIVARNCIEYLEVACGVPDAGVAVATVNSRYTTAEIEAVCDDAEARAIFTDGACAAAVRAGRYRTVTRVIEFGPDYERWLGRGAGVTARPPVDEWDTWTMPYTSGTTGRPKGVLLSHRGRSLLALAAASEFGCFSPDDRFLAMTPMNHGGGLAFPVAALLTGGSVELMERFDPLEVLRKLKSGGITGIFMVPTHFHQIFALDPTVLARFERPPVKAIISNAAPLPQVCLLYTSPSPRD